MLFAEGFHFLAAGLVPQAVENTWRFFIDGGVFMALIVGCSLVALAVILYKVVTLTRDSVLPDRLAGEVERLEGQIAGGEGQRLEREFTEGETTLARLCGVATRNSRRSAAEMQEAVTASAREEVVKMHAGLSVLDVVITVAPLLGLLGTASGLVVIFGNTEDLTSGVNNAKIGAGIARALGTTIAGLVVAVPSVVAHSYFTRKIETMAARLEVLLGVVIAALQQNRGAPIAEPVQADPQRSLTPQLTNLPQ